MESSSNGIVLRWGSQIWSSRSTMAKLVAFLCAVFAAAAPAWPMEFRIENDHIYAAGAVQTGDAGRLKQLLESRTARQFREGEFMHLAGSGGSVLAAVALGRVIRDGEIETHVDRAAACSDACAIAFLGGRRVYATGIGVGRVLEAGATLEFAPLPPALLTGDERSALGAVLDYAREMAGIDLGWLAAALTAAPGETARVTRPREIVALKIDVTGLPEAPPAGWASWACRSLVARHAPTLDGLQRVSGRQEPIRTIKDLRRILAGKRLDGTLVGNLTARLSDRDAIAVVLGPDLESRFREPVLEAQRLELERGAGFYYDTCLALRWKSGTSLMLLDDNGPSMVLEPYVGRWTMHDPLERLWVTAPPREAQPQ